MKTLQTLFLACALACLVGGGKTMADINTQSDGSDGDLIVNQSTNIDLSLAVTGQWNMDNNANAGLGIYDPSVWAVVFKWRSITINGGATVTFKNHPSHAPVVWLVKGAVTINGTVTLNGQGYVSPPLLAEPGPGGFRGGMGYFGGGALSSAGFGPGGGPFYTYSGAYGFGSGASYGSTGSSWNSTPTSPPYGNPSLIPLVGGSGGGGYYYNASACGGGGGGAILIACGTTLSLNGLIQANGGAGYNNSGSGSGGAIRLVADTILGSGTNLAVGGVDGYAGGAGRIRVEEVSTNTTLTFMPPPSVLQLASGATPPLWMPNGGPAVTVESISGVAAPADPRASFGALGADVVLPQLTNITVSVVTTNVEPASTIYVRATPRVNGNYTEATASFDSYLTGDNSVIRWVANIPVNNGYAAVIVRVVRP